MKRGIRIGLGAVAATAALAALPGFAAAASPYFVAPTPSGTANCSSSANACDIYTGVGMATMAGDEVLLANGTYTLSSGALILNNAITVKPQTTGTRPTITDAVGDGVSVAIAGATIQDVTIDISGLASSARALDLQAAGTALRVDVIADGTSPIGVQIREGGLLSDSIVRTAASGGRAVLFGGTGGVVRNVIAYATGSSSFGVAADGNFTAPGTNQVANVYNTVTRGVATDLGAFNPGADAVTVNVGHSNYTTTEPPPPTAGAAINDLGGNQSQTPLFANPGGGNFTELAGSATIDAGATAPGGPGLGGGLGPLDFGGEARVMGQSVDIGADEFPAAGPPQFPNAASTSTTSSSSKKKKCKKKKGKKSALAAKKKCKKKKK